MVWAGLEAAMRIAAKAHSISLTRPDSWSLMRELVSNGILNRDSYQQLTELFRLRSAFAHGIQPTSVPSGIALDQALETLSRLAEELVSESSIRRRK